MSGWQWWEWCTLCPHNLRTKTSKYLLNSLHDLSVSEKATFCSWGSPPKAQPPIEKTFEKLEPFEVKLPGCRIRKCFRDATVSCWLSAATATFSSFLRESCDIILTLLLFDVKRDCNYLVGGWKLNSVSTSLRFEYKVYAFTEKSTQLSLRILGDQQINYL